MNQTGLEPKVNAIVERLNRHIPFNPDHAEIYEEFQEQTFLHIRTAAEDFLVERVSREGAALIILTGDAGHGKTHLVRHLLKSLGVSDKDVLQKLQKECSGVPFEIGGRRIAVHKDLSELPAADAALLLGGAEALGCPLVVCVNEGRLRALLSQDAMRHTELARTIQDALEHDKIEPRPGVILLNLNWQMVSLPDGLLVNLLKEILDGRRWKTCQGCSSNPRCPILANRNILVHGEHSQRLEIIRKLYEVVEQLGEVVTIRQVLIHLAFLMTGNQSCKTVHKMSDEALSRVAHTSTLFGVGAPESFVRSHGLFERLQRLDPAYCADRAVDELLQQPHHRASILPENSPDRYLRVKNHRVDLRQQLSPVNLDLDERHHIDIESDFLRRAFHILRRHHLLELKDQFEVAGFKHVHAFLNLLEGDKMPKLKKNHYLKLMVNGLHRLQFLPPQQDGFYVVDPVSLRARAETAVISRKLSRQEVSLVPEAPPVFVHDVVAIDARPRRLLLKIETQTLPLGLLDFEFLCNCAEGLVSREFFTHTVRRLTNFLLKVAEDGDPQGRMSARIFFKGGVRSITVEDGSITAD